MDLLRTHFARVQPLSDYLQLRTEADRTLCEGHIVCVAATEAADNAVPVECSQHSQGEHHQTEVVNNAIEHLVRNNVRNSVLSLGFTRLSNTENAAAVAGIHGVQNVWPNSAVSILKSNRWQHLLDRIGPRAMSHLLLSVSVFVELPNNCFVQLTGLAISELPNPSAAFTKFWLQGLNDKSYLKRPAELMGIPTILPAAKVIKLDSLKSTPTPTPLGSPRKTGNDIPIHPSICLKNNDIVIPRFKVFYKRPIHGASGRISYGLPKNPVEKFIQLQRFESFSLEFILKGIKLMKNRTLSFSYIRLLPKENGFRPITNLRRRIVPRGVSSKEAKYAQSINSILQNAFQVLKYESGDVLKDGATVCGLTDIYPRLKAFKDRMRKVRPQQLYFVKADIVACFDNINQEKLMQILRDVVREEEYLIQKYSVTFASVGKVKREYTKRAKKSDDFTQFATLAKQLAGNMRNAIFTDNVVYSLEDREELLVLLEEHICNNLIKMGKRFYQQVLGIPQGSVLSSLLCSFFLSHMEKHKLGKLVSTNELLLRLVDDFLFVTPSKAKAIAFVQLLHQGISDYGCSVNPLKTVINFDLEDSGVKLKRVESLSELKSPRDFPWCGLLIDMKKLHVKVDYIRLSGTSSVFL
ncbi:hypothetical protein HDU99_001757 [Rhizoclosmatium hyalinum]|nr:hypothetical protein HDU99_001757 [Rhizoclosmatium hyalinum]